MFHVSQDSAGLEASTCMFQRFHPDSLGGFQTLPPAPAQMFQDYRESWHCCVIYYSVPSPLASALQVFGSLNVMEKGSIWRHGTLSSFCGFFFSLKRQNPLLSLQHLSYPRSHLGQRTLLQGHSQERKMYSFCSREESIKTGMEIGRRSSERPKVSSSERQWERKSVSAKGFPLSPLLSPHPLSFLHTPPGEMGEETWQAILSPINLWCNN